MVAVTYSQSYTFRDNRGFTGVTRLVLHDTNEAVSLPDSVASTIAGLLGLMTNATLCSANGIYRLAPVRPVVFGAGTEFPNAEDVVHLVFTTGVNGMLAKITIPAPLAGIFLPSDYRTVDKTQADVVNLVNYLTGVTSPGNYMVSPTSLGQVTALVTGYRKRNRLDRRRVNNLTLAHP